VTARTKCRASLAGLVAGAAIAFMVAGAAYAERTPFGQAVIDAAMSEPELPQPRLVRDRSIRR
jgi:hypothetical protein